MPIYEYACDTCQTTFERKQKFSEDPVRVCPECGNGVRRVLHPAGIIFKGSGFYVTDNRSSNGASKSANGSNGTSSPAESNGSTSASSSSDSGSTSKATSAASEAADN
jgi:putative FmdB family regulatory protein